MFFKIHNKLHKIFTHWLIINVFIAVLHIWMNVGHLDYDKPIKVK